MVVELVVEILVVSTLLDTTSTETEDVVGTSRFVAVLTLANTGNPGEINFPVIS
jgi:hypothetical protein